MDTTEIESKWESEGYAVDVERKTFPPNLSTPPHSHPFDARVLGIVSKPVQKLVGRLTLFQGILQVLSHRKAT